MEEITVSTFYKRLSSSAKNISSKKNITGSTTLEHAPYHTPLVLHKRVVIREKTILEVGTIIYKLMRNKDQDFRSSKLYPPYNLETLDLLTISHKSGKLVEEVIYNISVNELDLLGKVCVRARTLPCSKNVQLVADTNFNYLLCSIFDITYSGSLLPRSDMRVVCSMNNNLLINTRFELYNEQLLSWKPYLEGLIPTEGTDFNSDLHAAFLKASERGLAKFSLWREPNNFIKIAEDALVKLNIKDGEEFAKSIYAELPNYYMFKGVVSYKSALALVVKFATKGELEKLYINHKTGFELILPLLRILPEKIAGLKPYKKVTLNILEANVKQALSKLK